MGGRVSGGGVGMSVRERVVGLSKKPLHRPRVLVGVTRAGGVSTSVMAVGTAVADTLTVPAKKLGPMGNALFGGWLYDALPGNEMFTRYTPVAANLHGNPRHQHASMSLACAGYLALGLPPSARQHAHGLGRQLY